MIYYNNFEILKYLIENEDIFQSFFDQFLSNVYDSIEFLYELNSILKTIHQVKFAFIIFN